MPDTDSIKKLALDFESVLDGSSEQEIHQFMVDNPQLLDFLLRRVGFLKSKFRLADAFVPDFVAIGGEYRTGNRLEPAVTFVEIERADIPLFTKAGDPTAQLTHAIRQVQNWKKWVTDNSRYLWTVFSRLMSEESERNLELDGEFKRFLLRGANYGFVPRYYVIAGRRTNLRVADRLLLSQMNEDLMGISIMTYDVILDHILQSIGK